ncbi:hypothetical protein KUTeg_014080 [Tegillarca granosa]|uniref:Nesprin-1 n=1 Tax=Tegillarca granosa TaxID=220873 RepID=A0ABQ9EZ55_TEGGR|nr:hypothetical protein KUTeg_014080 [Tegillarca granosa]
MPELRKEIEFFQELRIELMQDIKAHQREVDNFSDEAQTLQQLTGESRDILKKCEQNVADHKFYKDKHAECTHWLAKAKDKYATSSDLTGSRVELEDRLEKIQELSVDRDAGFAKLNQVVEAGEKLYPNCSTEGREVVRQELRQLKIGWESLFDDLSATQRKLEVALVQWTSFDDSYGQVEHWLRDMESQLEGQLPLRSTLEEKKTQLQNYKVLHQDVLSYQRVIDSVNDKAQSLSQSSSDPHLSKFVTQARTRYQKLTSTAKVQYSVLSNINTHERVHQYEDFVADHQQYNDGYNNCIEWLNGIREKLSMCADVSGDRHAIQNRLDKIQIVYTFTYTCIYFTRGVHVGFISILQTNSIKVQRHSHVKEKNIALQILHFDIVATKMEGEPKVKHVIALAEKVLPNTAPQGKDIIMRETDALRSDWEAFVNALQKTKEDLENCMDQWKEFDTWQEKVDAWLKEIEGRIRDTELKATLKDKQSQLDKLKHLHRELMEHQGDIDALSDAAQDLVRVSTDTRVISQASQLGTKYSTMYNNVKVWLNDMRKKLQALTDTSGDRRIIQERLAQVQELMSDKEEGLHMLQIALDNLQIVLPNTSVPGRDNMRREMQGLQAEYDTLSADLNDLKSNLDGTLSQWTVLHLNIGSQQSTVDNLKDKAENLKQTSKDTNLSNQIRHLDQLQRCEKYVKDHQIYRDAYMDSSYWLTGISDRLNMCSDIRGDRTAIEAQLNKLQDIGNHIEAGNEKIKLTLSKGEIVLPETSSQGQELVREELSMLSGDFENFQADLEDLHANLEQYEELSQWIKDMETDMKAESDMKATLEDKAIQLEKQQAINDEILEKQTAFDALTERAQTLLQSTTDNRVTSQLTQMSSRYTTLIAGSKDLMKRYEQHVLDHEKYAEAFTEAATWLQSTRDRLSVCADTSGDKYTIQTQLEKLQEFVVVKEEGQLLIHTANTWGEKAMTNTSMEGREMIRKELQQLQQEWDNMIGEVTDTKVMLESCLLQWTDFNASYDQIQKRLRDMERRIRESEPKADLSEKKADLQRIRGLYQDVISYEQMIESIGSKAHDLSSKSPASKASTDTSQIVGKYQSIRDQAKDLLGRSEQCVAQHQAYHDACNSFVTWLRAAREKLATCSDTFGEKSAVISKIERSKALTADLSEGSERLVEATKSGEATLSSTSPTGQTKIRNELQAMRRDFEEYQTLLLEAQEDLERYLILVSFVSYAFYFYFIDVRVAEFNFLVCLLLTVKNYLDEVLAHQNSLDQVSEKAQALLQTNADAKTSHAITQLTTRYHGVIALSKIQNEIDFCRSCVDIVKNLENFFENHMNYNQNHNDFQDWLAETKIKLQHVHDTSGTKDDVDTKLHKIMDLQAAMDQGHIYLRALLECSDKTLPSTNKRGCQVIRQETENAKADYENMLTNVSQAKRGLESALSQWSDFDRSFDQFNSWLLETESKLKKDPDFRADLPEKRSSLEKFKALQGDIAAHKDILEKLEDKAAQLKDTKPSTIVGDLRTRYQRLTAACKEGTVKLEDQVQGHEEYRKAYIACLDWLANNRHKLQRLSDYSGDRRTLQDRLQQLKKANGKLCNVKDFKLGTAELSTDFKGEMRQGQDMVNNATQLGERVCLTTAPRGQDAIHRELQNMKDDWNSFANSVNDMEANLEACISKWLDLDDEYQRFQQWIDKMDARVKSLAENKPDLQRKQQQLRDGEDIFDEILKKKAMLENVRESTDAVAQRSSDPRVTNTAHWLAMMDERVQECNDTSGDWNSIQDRMDDIKDITGSMDEGLQKVNRVCDIAEKILPNTSSEGKRMIEQQVTELTNEWEKLNLAISDCSTMLEGVLDRWNEV